MCEPISHFTNVVRADRFVFVSGEVASDAEGVHPRRQRRYRPGPPGGVWPNAMARTAAPHRSSTGTLLTYWIDPGRAIGWRVPSAPARTLLVDWGLRGRVDGHLPAGSVCHDRPACP